MLNYFSSLNRKIKGLQKRARKKNIPFNIDKGWIDSKLKKGYCEATGIKFNYSKTPFVNPFYPSIDRVDSSKGYTKDNCKMVCHMYNSAKCEFSEEVFITWAKAYVERYEERYEKKHE